MQVVYIASNLADTARLDFEDELTSLQRALDRNARREAVALRVYPKVSIEELPHILQQPVDILQVSAHGSDEGVLLAGPDGGDRLLTAADLKDLLQSSQLRPKLVLINACRSDDTARALTACADFVIGTDASVTDRGAVVMAATLLGQLANGDTIHHAFTAARAMLRIVDAGRCDVNLWVAPGRDPYRTTMLERFRILASFPELDQALAKGKGAPRRPPALIEDGVVSFEFGVAGAPADTTQLVLFTDDASFVDAAKEVDSVEEALSWIVREAPVAGEIWVEPPARITGDCRWFAVATTAGGQVHVAVSKATEALRRFYIEEVWKGSLPISYATEVQRAISALHVNNGSRRRAVTTEVEPSPNA